MSRGIEFISGQRGTGKTKYLISRVLRRENRFFVYDHMNELAGRAPGHRFFQLEESIDYCARNARGFCMVYFAPTEGATSEDFKVVCSVPFGFKDMTLVLDEVDQLAGSVSPPPPPELLKLVRFGRHFGSSIVAIARRPADVSRALTSQARRFVCFRQTEPSDLKFLRSVCGPQAKKIPELRDLEYLAFESGVCTRGRVDANA